MEECLMRLMLSFTCERPTTTRLVRQPTYSAWQPLVNAVLKARAFQFKAVLTSSDAAQNVGR